MLFARTCLLTSIFLTTISIPAMANDDALPVLVAQATYDVFIDEYGRRVLVDPYTGEIVGTVGNDARAWRRQQRRLRLRERRRRWAHREYEEFFDDEDDAFLERRPRSRRGFYLDEYNRREHRAKRQQPSQRKHKLRKKPKVEADEQVARLPEPGSKIQREPYRPLKKPKLNSEQIASLQVYLDREGFSPGVIDGQWGSNVEKALSAWRQVNGKKTDLRDPLILDRAIAKSGKAIFTTYKITSDDVKGPYIARVPIDYARKAKLSSLSYTSVTEALAERFHMSESYLKKLNKGKKFSQSGTEIKVVVPGPSSRRKVHYIIADKSLKQLRALDRNGELVVAYPATIGSEATPSPSGKHTIDRIALNPEYTYNPKINFQQGSNDKILRIPPGPNGPVGSVWIALSKPTYGIHGTPNPRTIGKTSSHGCIRLTNWDATELASLVTEGVTVEFRN